MIRRLSATVLLCMTAGCSSGATEDAPVPASHEVFAGTWRSVTPSLEFVGLTVASKSSEQGALGARLTLSGVAWEGSGHIDGDSLVANMMMAGTSVPIGSIVVHPSASNRLRLRMQPTTGTPTDLTFVRDN